MLAGHIDTVPIADNVPSRLRRRRPDPRLRHHRHEVRRRDAAAPRGHPARAVPRPDLRLLRLRGDRPRTQRADPDRTGAAATGWPPTWRSSAKPTNGTVEAGCQGTAAVEITLAGKRAHTARAWMGHQRDPRGRAGAGPARRLSRPRRRHRRLSSTGRDSTRCSISGGVAGNVIPDECVVQVNFRFAPDRDADAARGDPARSTSTATTSPLLDIAAGARPGLTHRRPPSSWPPPAASAVAKFGWTDVARFAALGIPAVNYGPGDPSLAHTREEHVSRRPRSARWPPCSCDVPALTGATTPNGDRAPQQDRGAQREGGGRGPGRARAARRTTPSIPTGRFRERIRGPVRAARRPAPCSPRPPTNGCWTPAVRRDWVHTDPWRVIRIQAEFVEGFGSLSNLPRAVIGVR